MPVLASVLVGIAGVSALAGLPQIATEKKAATSEYPACRYARNNARFDSCACGAIADYVALQIQTTDPSALIVVDGFAIKNERAGIEASRAQRAYNYLVYERGIDPERVLLRWTRLAPDGASPVPGRLRISFVRPGEAIPSLTLDQEEMESIAPSVAPK